MPVEDLKSGDAEERERAAYKLFMENAQAAAGNADAAASLAQMIEKGTESVSAILLAGSSSDQKIPGLLRKLRAEKGETRAKLHNWSLPAELGWAIDVALSRVGDAEARNRLLSGVAEADTAARLLLLDVLGAIDDPSVIHQVATFLDDGTEINEGVPSGVEPRRRVKDKAVDALVKRLNLKFATNESSRYSDEQVAEVRNLIRGSIPS